MSKSNEEYVKTLHELLVQLKPEEFEALYPFVEARLKEQKEYVLLTKIYSDRAALYFRFNKIEELVKFIAQHVTLFRKYAEEEELIRFHNARAIALEMNGYTEGFYEQMLKMKAYGEKKENVELIVNALINIGMLKGKTNELKQSLVYFQQAYELAKARKETNTIMFDNYCLCINNLMGVYLSLQDYEAASAYLHLDDLFSRCYLRYNIIYRANVAKYYLDTGQLQQASERLTVLCREIEKDEANAVYDIHILEFEVLLARALGDVAYEVDALKNIIAIQKKSKQKRLLQTMMQSTYNVKRQELIEATQRDPLTKLYNRGGFVTQTEQLKRDNKDALYIVCGMIDIDYFKQINDAYGHLAGDEVIVGVANVLKQYEERGFVCARHGGDEFVFTFVANDEQYIKQHVEALYEALRETKFQCDGVTIAATVTMGVAYVKQNDACPVDKLLKLADEVMYDVKRNGRAYYVIQHVDEQGVTI